MRMRAGACAIERIMRRQGARAHGQRMARKTLAYMHALTDTVVWGLQMRRVAPCGSRASSSVRHSALRPAAHTAICAWPSPASARARLAARPLVGT